MTVTCRWRLGDEQDVEVTTTVLFLAETVLRRGRIHKGGWACVAVRGELCRNTLADLRAPPI